MWVPFIRKRQLHQCICSKCVIANSAWNVLRVRPIQLKRNRLANTLKGHLECWPMCGLVIWDRYNDEKCWLLIHELTQSQNWMASLCSGYLIKITQGHFMVCSEGIIKHDFIFAKNAFFRGPSWWQATMLERKLKWHSIKYFSPQRFPTFSSALFGSWETFS